MKLMNIFQLHLCSPLTKSENFNGVGADRARKGREINFEDIFNMKLSIDKILSERLKRALLPNSRSSWGKEPKDVEVINSVKAF